MASTFENMIPRYDLREQIEAVVFQEPTPSMFLSSFFKGEDKFSSAEKIEWDEVKQGSSMAKYVDENLEVEATEREPFITREIESPIVQEKRVLTVAELKRRQPGENIYSSKTPAQRAQDYTIEDYAICMNAIDARVEQQCASMMVHGRVDIIGKGVNRYVDYNLPLKMTLLGSDRWNQSNGDPIFKSLQEMSRVLRKRGHKPTALLMELSVANIFIKNFEAWKSWLDISRADLGRLEPGPVTDMFKEAQFIGQIKYPGIGIIDLYAYDGTYKDENNNEVPYLDEGRVLMLSEEALQNYMLYGAVTVIDENDKFITVEGRYVPEFFTDRRAKTQTIKMTSRPMPVPRKNDSWWTAKVL